MSDTATPAQLRIRAQALPRDPDAMRFHLDAPVGDGRSLTFDAPDATAPLARALFAVPGVTGVHVGGPTVTVTQDGGHDWAALKAEIAAAIRAVMASDEDPLGPPSEESGEARLLAQVQDLLDRQANPAIAAHGGHVSVDKVEGSTVYLRMSGGCQGCAASAATLRQGVETMLRAALPQIGKIVDVTDHSAGSNPYFKDETGRSPALLRPLPGGAVEVATDGRVMLDPTVLAPKLGLEAPAFRAALNTGAVVAQAETGEGADAGRIRVVLRGAGRAWAAELHTDGRAYEVPPPRAVIDAARAERDLQSRIRAHLGSRPADQLPLSYGQLARALGLYLPGSVAKVTAALEGLMREDAAADRPFIAALAVSRGRDGLPGQGFFDLAAKLGREPEPGESSADWYRRVARAALDAR